jgi:tetratricopeptide (TPR) repeat protein
VTSTLARLLALCAAIAAVLALISPAHAQSRRVALVVGIDAYQHIAPLKKAVGDGRAIAAALSTDLRFDAVITAENPTRRQLNAKLGEFEAAVRPGDLAMFFFSGHGVALGAENILLPADLPRPGPGQEEVVREEGVSVDNIVRRIQRKGARVTLMVIDACRDNPFEQGGIKSIGASRGLARPDTPQGVFMLFAAGVGQTARDRLSDADPAPTSIFTRHFVPALITPGLTLVQIAKRVQQEVDTTARTVAHAQQPAYYDQIVGEVVLRDGPQTLPRSPVAVAASVPSKLEVSAKSMPIPQSRTNADLASRMTAAVAIAQSIKERDGKFRAMLLIAEAQAKSGLAMEARATFELALTAAGPESRYDKFDLNRKYSAVATAQLKAGFRDDGLRVLEKLVDITRSIKSNDTFNYAVEGNSLRVKSMFRTAVVQSLFGFHRDAASTINAGDVVASLKDTDTGSVDMLVSIFEIQHAAGLHKEGDRTNARALQLADSRALDKYRSAWSHATIAAAHSKVGQATESKFQVAIRKALIIDEESYKSWTLIAIAQAQAKVGLVKEATKTLELALQAARQSDRVQNIRQVFAAQPVSNGVEAQRLGIEAMEPREQRAWGWLGFAEAQLRAGFRRDAAESAGLAHLDASAIENLEMKVKTFVEIGKLQEKCALYDLAEGTISSALITAREVIDIKIRAELLAHIGEAWVKVGATEKGRATTIEDDPSRRHLTAKIAKTHAAIGDLITAEKVLAASGVETEGRGAIISGLIGE